MHGDKTSNQGQEPLIGTLDYPTSAKQFDHEFGGIPEDYIVTAKRAEIAAERAKVPPNARGVAEAVAIGTLAAHRRLGREQ